SRRDAVNCGDLTNLFADAMRDGAGESLGSPRAHNHEVHATPLVEIAERAFETVGYSDEGNHSGHCDGHTNRGQGRPRLPLQDVLQNELIKTHLPYLLTTEATVNTDKKVSGFLLSVLSVLSVVKLFFSMLGPPDDAIAHSKPQRMDFP